jgi:hypothetical protein
MKRGRRARMSALMARSRQYRPGFSPKPRWYFARGEEARAQSVDYRFVINFCEVIPESGGT